MPPLVAFTWPPPGRARREQAEAGDDLVGEHFGQALNRGLLGGDGRIFGADDVDPGVRPGGRVEDHAAAAQIDQPVAGAQRPPLAGHGAVAADAEAGDIVVELDLEPVDRRPAAGPPSRSINLLCTSQPTWPSIGATSTARRVVATVLPDAAAVERLQPAGRHSASGREARRAARIMRRYSPAGRERQ